jgi:2-polyprenyl-3-methyl-5-hydroxy-6-metoxy-1,4-benzoquinol methylase
MAANIAFHSSYGLPQAVPQRPAVQRQPFDQLHYLKLIRARGEIIRNVLHRVKPLLGLSTAVDAGGGVGFFSQTLLDCDLNVCGVDGRPENILEAMSMVRVRQDKANFETVSHPAANKQGR